jgi:hypothetical protein
MWNRDYFTTCLPWPQKGDDVMFPPLATLTLDPTYRYSVKADPMSSGDPRFYQQGTSYVYPKPGAAYFAGPPEDGKMSSQPLGNFTTTGGSVSTNASTGKTTAYSGTTGATASYRIPSVNLDMNKTTVNLPKQDFTIDMDRQEVEFDDPYIAARTHPQDPIAFNVQGTPIHTNPATVSIDVSGIPSFMEIRNRNESSKPLSNLQVYPLDGTQQVWAVDTSLPNYQSALYSQTSVSARKDAAIPSLSGQCDYVYSQTDKYNVRLSRQSVNIEGEVPRHNQGTSLPSRSFDFTTSGATQGQTVSLPGQSFTVPAGDVPIPAGTGSAASQGINFASGGSAPLGYFPNGQLYVDVNADPVTQGSMNQLRMAVQLQKWLERNARGGTRYVEFIKAHFGVRSSDARLQRPEFLGGGRCPLVFSEVLQTSASPASATKAPLATTGTPLATMGGHSFGAIRTRPITKTCEEHGWIIGILSIVPRTAYVQALEKKFRPRTRMDYYMPEFAHLGEQAVRNDEVHCTFKTTDDLVFGYQPIYEHYRRAIDHVNGDFRSTLNYWHFARTFTDAPPLNADFLFAKPTTAPFAVSTGDTCWIQFLNKVRAIRPIPRRAEPGLMDHF